MTDKAPAEFSSKKHNMLRAMRAIRALANHTYSREDVVTLMKLHKNFTDIIEAKREEAIIREGPKSKLILPGDIN